MDARTSRMLASARRQAEADRARAAAAREKLAAGNTRLVDLLRTAVLRLFDGDLRIDELRAGADAIAEAFAAHAITTILDTLGIAPTDPRVLGGSILTASEDPDSVGTSLIDTTNALLVDALDVVSIDEERARIIALMVDGRINKTTDRHRLVMIGGVEIAAAFIVELYALAARGGFEPALQAAIDQHTARLPGPPGPDQPEGPTNARP